MPFKALNSYDTTDCVCSSGGIFQRHLFIINVDKCILKAWEHVASGVFVYLFSLVHFHIICNILKSIQRNKNTQTQDH